MPTILETLNQNPEDLALLHDAYRGFFLEGECYAFAIALHQGLGWPIVGLIKPYDKASKERDVIWHAGVRTPDHRTYYDVRGSLTDREFGSHFLTPPFYIREVTVDELYSTRHIEDRTIDMARRIAETLWPDLPWIQTTAMRVKAFADELEELSRKHGFWICAGVPADPPRLFTGGGDEGGYRIRPTSSGLVHTIDRYLPFQIQLEEACRASVE